MIEDRSIAPRRVYKTINEALKHGHNVGRFGILNLIDGKANYRDWRLFGDCLEFNTGDGWEPLCSQALDHPFSLGVIAIHANVVLPSLEKIAEEVFDDVF